jgi:hypothetical protein
MPLVATAATVNRPTSELVRSTVLTVATAAPTRCGCIQNRCGIISPEFEKTIS